MTPGHVQVEFYRGNIEGRGEALEYYGAAAQLAARPVIDQSIQIRMVKAMMPTMKTTMITVIMAMTNLTYILGRCCPHARTPKNCNTTEQQRLRSVASLTHFLPAR